MFLVCFAQSTKYHLFSFGNVSNASKLARELHLIHGLHSFNYKVLVKEFVYLWKIMLINDDLTKYALFYSGTYKGVIALPCQECRQSF